MKTVDYSRLAGCSFRRPWDDLEGTLRQNHYCKDFVAEANYIFRYDEWRGKWHSRCPGITIEGNL